MDARPVDLLTRSGRLLRIRPVEAADPCVHHASCDHAHGGVGYLVAEIGGRVVAVLSHHHHHGGGRHVHLCYAAGARGDGIGGHLLAVAGHVGGRELVTICG
jgi:hypothetical protein